MARVAINGFGRIGRAVFKILDDRPDLELVAVNDIVPIDTLAYLLRFDTVYGRYPKSVRIEEDSLHVDDNTYKVLNETDPAQLPWSEMNVDIVFECTGVFRQREDLEKHVQAGAKYVFLSAPAKSEDISTLVHGVTTREGEANIVSCASCTTNCITPVVEILGRHIGIAKATMTTIHAYTASQELVDSPKDDKRRGRAAAENLVPTSTGAAVATARALPQYEGKFDGVAVRAPVPVGSIADIVLLTERQTSVEEINEIFREEAQQPQYREVISVSDEPLVSTDIIQDPHASIVDLSMTQVVDGDLVKVMSWYDNEWGYASQLVREAAQLASESQKVTTAQPAGG